MDGKRLDDRELDGLLREHLAGTELPDEGAVASLKRQMRLKGGGRRSPSLWWLPALCGTAFSASLLYALSFVADWKCFAAAAAILGMSTVSAWLLTLYGAIKINSFKEVSKLI